MSLGLILALVESTYSSAGKSEKGVKAVIGFGMAAEVGEDGE